MKSLNKSHIIQSILVLVMFVFFVTSIVMVLISGANAYNGIVKKQAGRYEERTCLTYISSKIRHYDEKDAISINNIMGTNALCLKDKNNKEGYITYIYYHKGYLKELFTNENNKGVTLNSGQKIIKIKDLSFEKKANNLIKLKCTNENGESSSIYVNVKSGVVK